jgi:outer membrane lipoprotein LolB
MVKIVSFFNPTRAAALLALLPLLLTGCATLTEPAATRQAMAPPAYHDAIDIGGRLSVRYQQNGNEQAVHGNFTWVQSPAHTTITLLSPLGQTIALIDITPTSSTLTQSGQAPRSAANVDALAADALGWPLPVSGLRNWLQGFTLDANGRRSAAAPQAADGANVAAEDGWRILYASWQQDAGPAAAARPRRIDLERSSAQSGDVALRIVIDSWQPR